MFHRCLQLIKITYTPLCFLLSIPAGETWGQLLIFSSLRVSLLLATRTLRDGSSTGVSSIFREDRDLELTKTTVRAEMKWDCWSAKKSEKNDSTTTLQLTKCLIYLHLYIDSSISLAWMSRFTALFMICQPKITIQEVHCFHLAS